MSAASDFDVQGVKTNTFRAVDNTIFTDRRGKDRRSKTLKATDSAERRFKGNERRAGGGFSDKPWWLMVNYVDYIV